jgi:hypothetical protein
MSKQILWLILISVCASCHKDKATTIPLSKGVYIMNEGNFNFGNGEVSFYDPHTNEVSNGLFHAANGYFLGDVVQSMYIRDSVGFIVVNNSQKIEMVKIPSFKHVRTITLPRSNPRNFFPVNDSIAYVSELYAMKIWVVNFQTGALVDSVTTESWTENILQIGTDIFVQQKVLSTVPSSRAALLKVNTVNHTAQYNRSFGARDINGMVKDKLNRIWIAVDEDTAHGLHAGFYCFDQDMVEQKSFFYSSYNHNPSRLCIDSKGEKLFYADKDVFSFSIQDNAVSSTAFIPGDGKNIYAMDIDPSSDDVYLSDALDFVQQSRIYRYDKNGSLIHSFTAGIISGNFAFNGE